MKLVIAEKPSVAQSLARVIGATKRQDGYLEGNGYLVSWCVGHLVELSAPERYDERFAKWRLEDLPILPEHFLYEVSAGTSKQYQILKGLMERPDVESLVCATDAGREGELIFRLVYNQCRCKKPFERLWISSMEDTAIREGFEKLKPGTAYDALYEAALCRERADWIVGMNATRLFSCLYGQTLALVHVDAAEVKEGKTSPPKHFTEDTLLSAMETAGADETPDEAERKGLGTPATRAATIEKLVQRGFIERKGDKKTRQLIATDKGNSLITVMPEQIQSASMTAEWEQKLLQVEHGELDGGEFMSGIEGMVANLVTTYEKVKGADALMSRNKVIGTCPHCGAEVLERQKGWFCSNRECRFVLWKDNAYFTKIGKRLTPQVVERLLRDGRVKLKDCKSQKTGKTYNADLILTTEDDGRPRFSMEFENRKEAQRPERKVMNGYGS